MPKEQEKPLYEDTELKLELLPNSGEDHVVYHKVPNKEDEYLLILPRGILRELALTKRGGIEKILNTMDPHALYFLNNKKISVDGLHIAICQAYAEEERRFREWYDKENRKKAAQ